MDTVVVTGGTRGLGLGIVRRLLSEGYRVIALGRTLSEELAVLINENSSRLIFETYNLNDLSGIHAFAARLQKDYGPLYGLVNNAALGHGALLPTQHENEIGALLRVNLEAPILLTKYLLRSMLIAGRGRIVNISSVVATTGYKGLAVYGATKAGLIGFTRSLARDVGKAGITVNAVAPGYMETDMTHGLEGEKLESIRRRSPLGRLPEIEDVAGAVSYLLSAQARNITGITLTVDAGSTA
ncbi:SDR family NAD(P)-dependent oxidoreductase [Geoalkalibacter halelectricus]|uniref:SDR family oxidoreductase n=1 Tax=Geoalkalibacter halelectricus TaxID=2847045 RepID=A0ABY5ZSM4_9BACT|nr:SDR family NAD(P)-dependent oxidoreductase [Geoalkalibacter halelectricus]MDO3377973.1 SDR family oxidoreductase [Geoalkalibacter halelectricus]UWZ81524.1 SDR family oxidoreductase [Geoalkalibacter halelectricus]